MQNIVSSVGLRKWLVKQRTQSLLSQSQEIILQGPDSARLQGFYLPQKNTDSLVILLHGWEGSSDSAYILSATQALFDQGHAIFRLNFRDHGDSHHLNQELFNSTRLSDITGALTDLQQQLPHTHYSLAGFSLGGNFALRTTMAQTNNAYRIDRAVAVCPVICPSDTMEALSKGFYERYFVKKWKQSLLKKTTHFPEYTYQNQLKLVKTLKDMNEFFIPGYTPYSDTSSYFDAYHLRENRLKELPVPTTIITSEDDPIVRVKMLPRQPLTDNLSLEVTRYGSHCAFLKNFKMQSWIDDRLVDLFSRTR
ncbi:alpha/beta fold hydrolase [Aestuariicella hydrocarbonica]|uniref:Alpha/beta fold hydrolase n=1 Tax=Pseudomaricurvus hydrocarbonicus TaxID=1470433 RepID=A0A9E5ML41_9GAMM|nr:alpha/beta fold hydrolase [Aestuariicella hydrocarbonica]